MKNFLLFDNISTADYEVHISGVDTYKTPERDEEIVSIPGKNGDVIFDNGRYKNVTIPYECFVREDFREKHEALRNALRSRRGYKRLEDTYHADEFRIARYVSMSDPAVSMEHKRGRFTIKFDCKPQRFLKSGEITRVYTGDGAIYNPTEEIALPLVRVYGTGYVSIGDVTINVKKVDTYIDIDSDLQDAYKGITNKNMDITLPKNREFFSIPPGKNGVSMSGNVTRVEIIPRWFRT